MASNTIRDTSSDDCAAPTALYRFPMRTQRLRAGLTSRRASGAINVTASSGGNRSNRPLILDGLSGLTGIENHESQTGLDEFHFDQHFMMCLGCDTISESFESDTMFGQIKVIVDLISFGLRDGWSFKDKIQRRANVLRMLETYFLLRDCLDEGYALVEEAGPNPVEKIRNMPVPEAKDLVRRWDYILRKQGRRLALLQDYLLGQDHLTVINPELQKKILEAIGSKFDRVTTLRGIGAALFFYNIFSLAESPEEKARYVLVMSGSRRHTISMPRIKREVKSLSQSLVQYREAIQKLISSEEVVRLSKEARKKTLFPALSVAGDFSNETPTISTANTGKSKLLGSRGKST